MPQVERTKMANYIMFLLLSFFVVVAIETYGFSENVPVQQQHREMFVVVMFVREYSRFGSYIS